MISRCGIRTELDLQKRRSQKIELGKPTSGACDQTERSSRFVITRLQSSVTGFTALRFEEAVQHYTMDVVKRMTDIKQVLDKTSGEETEESVAQKEKVLEELVEIVENIDYARGNILTSNLL